MSTIFQVEKRELSNLTPDRAVECLRRLLWNESARVGIGVHLISVPQCINVPDGGIDALILDAQPLDNTLIPCGTTGFQIKSSDLEPADCKKELHIDGNLDAPIKPEIKRILEAGGNYVLVLFAEITSRQWRNRNEAIRQELDRLGYQDNEVRVYPADQITGFMERFPAMVLCFKNIVSDGLFYSSWSQCLDIVRPRTFVYDDGRSTTIQQIRNKLRNPRAECPVVRITGLSGLGKTRLVHEVLNADDLRSRVIYTQSDIFRQSGLYSLLQNDNKLQAIMVIDNCELAEHDRYVRSFAARGSRLALITMSNEKGEIPSPTLSYEILPLSANKIEQLIKNETDKLPDDLVRRLANFADGYPRIAMLLTEDYLMSGGGDARFIGISDDVLMNRLIGGSLDFNSEPFSNIKKVLTGISLFRKIGFKDELSIEAKWVSEYFNIAWDTFVEIVKSQMKRGTIQGQHYINVTPFMLRIHLLKEWWYMHGFTKDNFIEFTNSIPEEIRHDMLIRFFDHLPYITSIETGREFAQSILSPNGLFSDGSLLNSQLGAEFFSKIAEGAPEEALSCLMRTVGNLNKDDLFKFDVGRRAVVQSLERIAMWRDLFPDAARLLLALAEAENENFANNATGVFVGLFSPGPGKVAPTEAPLKERFPILKEALESESKDRRILGLKAAEKALEIMHFVRSGGAEYQGLRNVPKLWEPKSKEEWKEWWDWYKNVWTLLRSRLDFIPEDEQKMAVDILLEKTRGLIRYLPDMVLDILQYITEKQLADRKAIIETIAHILHYDSHRIHPKTTERLHRLKEEMFGTSYSELLRRYVGISILEDLDSKWERTEKYKSTILQLARESVANIEQFYNELSWLVTVTTPNVYEFGQELAKQDEKYTLLPEIIDALRSTENHNNNLMSGYFRSIFEKDKNKWEQELDKLAADDKLYDLIPELTHRSGMTDRAALRILSLAREDKIHPAQLRNFSFGPVIITIPENIFHEWLEFLLESIDKSAASVALDLFYFYYMAEKGNKEKIPKNLTLQILTNDSLFDKEFVNNSGQLDEHNWTEIAKHYITLFPENQMIIAEKMVDHFQEEGTILTGFISLTTNVFNQIARQHRDEIWELVKTRIGPPIDHRAFGLREWLRGTDMPEKFCAGGLHLFNPKKIWEWVDEDVENRAWYLTSFVPKEPFKSEENICTPREVLIQYGERDDVRRNLSSNFGSEGWIGPASLHFQKKKEYFLNFKENETNDNVRRWLDMHIAEIDARIEHERINEERGYY